jgi:peptidoglycan/xylan/chitin deacetylase (PgdA/CDA1 family)
MHALKPLLLNVYYHTTYGYRQWWTRHAARQGRAPMVAPVFHRVTDDAANDWTTPTAAFREAIDWLQASFDLISLEEAQRRMRAGRNDRPSIILTFDDGYAVNMPALELLIERKIPCTYFVSTQPALERVPFDHDRRMGNHFEANTVEELRYLAQSGIEIGAHTRTHADLARVADADRLHDELVAARDDLQDAIGARVRYFAFPFGLHRNLSAPAFHLAREAGYEGVCSAYGGYNFPGDDAFHIQRRCVDGAAIVLKNWAVLDPLRYGRIQRFEYQQQGRLPMPAVAGSG